MRWLLGSILSLCLVSHAAARDYAIEVVFFSNPTASQARETWRASDEIPAQVNKQLQRMAASSKPRGSSSVGRLAAIRNALEQSGRRVLSTRSWRQKTASYDNAPVVSLAAPDNGLSQAFVRIYTTSLIYADVSAKLLGRALSTSSTGLDSSSNRRLAYVMNEKRRLKFKEVHYFDHPAFGAIIGVWPQ